MNDTLIEATFFTKLLKSANVTYVGLNEFNEGVTALWLDIRDMINDEAPFGLRLINTVGFIAVAAISLAVLYMSYCSIKVAVDFFRPKTDPNQALLDELAAHKRGFSEFRKVVEGVQKQMVDQKEHFNRSFSELIKIVESVQKPMIDQKAHFNTTRRNPWQSDICSDTDFNSEYVANDTLPCERGIEQLQSNESHFREPIRVVANIQRQMVDQKEYIKITLRGPWQSDTDSNSEYVASDTLPCGWDY